MGSFTPARDAMLLHDDRSGEVVEHGRNDQTGNASCDAVLQRPDATVKNRQPGALSEDLCLSVSLLGVGATGPPGSDVPLLRRPGERCFYAFCDGIGRLGTELHRLRGAE